MAQLKLVTEKSVELSTATEVKVADVFPLLVTVYATFPVFKPTVVFENPGLFKLRLATLFHP